MTEKILSRSGDTNGDLVSQLREIANMRKPYELGNHPFTRNAPADLLFDAANEIERFRTLLEDACQVFDHYDLPEHAFHYRRILKP